jgi:hypothetical protein
MRYIKVYENFYNEDIIEELRNIEIPDDYIKSELGQNNKFVVISFLKNGRPSEYYINKVKEMIKKFKV